MRRCRPAAVAALLAAAATAHAVAPQPTRTSRPAADELTALPAAGLARPLRTQRHLTFAPRPTAAWRHFTASIGGTWSAAWDRATGVPNRIWGSGLAAPGASASAAIAEQVARRVLADHLALLAPGAAPSDFALAGDHTDGDLRSIGFVQRASHLRVVGGQLSFRFKRDRLFVIASEALPHVAVPAPRARLAGPDLLSRAAAALRLQLALPAAPVTPAGDDVILPLVADDAVLGYRLAAPLQIDGGADGRYLAYVDPSTGAPLAVQQLNRYATGTLRYLAVDRHPLRGRRAVPAHRAHVAVASVPQTTTSDGGLSWPPDAPQPVDTAVVGDLVSITNRGPTGTLATAQLSLSPGGVALWDASSNSEQDAQLVVYTAANAAKEFVRANLDPAMPGLDQPLAANVNLSQTCNAFFDGRSINFMSAGPTCQNTGLIEDVVHHEFGHALHTAEIIDGVGAFDGALSEGAADFLAASITGDPGTARGFFYSDEPLRHLDPPGDEATWPEDIGEVHRTGQIYGGAMWDLRTSLIASLGGPAGLALTHRIYLATLRRATSIPSTLLEALATDDDDGDLTNGTPHECPIRAAFGRHGLRTASAIASQPGALDTSAPSTEITLDLSGLSSLCATDTIARVDLLWLPGYTRLPAAGTSAMTALTPTRFSAQLPLPADDVVSYSARVRFTDGTTLVAADNLADPVLLALPRPHRPSLLHHLR